MRYTTKVTWRRQNFSLLTSASQRIASIFFNYSGANSVHEWGTIIPDRTFKEVSNLSSSDIVTTLEHTKKIRLFPLNLQTLHSFIGHFWFMKNIFIVGTIRCLNLMPNISIFFILPSYFCANEIWAWYYCGAGIKSVFSSYVLVITILVYILKRWKKNIIIALD